MQTPKGVVIDESEQGSREWLAARAPIFTASEVWKLMCKQKNGTPYAARKDYITEIALSRITGEAPQSYSSSDMAEGTAREPVARFAYEIATGKDVETTGLWHNDIYGASPDGLVGDDGGVELKNPKPATHYKTLQTEKVPETYYWQVMQNLLVTNRNWWEYVSYHPSFPEHAQMFRKRFNRIDVAEDLAKLEKELVIANAEVEELVKSINNYRGQS